MNNKKNRRILFSLIWLFITLIYAFIGIAAYTNTRDAKREDALTLIQTNVERIELLLENDLNYAYDLKILAENSTNTDWFSKITNEMIAKDEIVLVSFIEDDTVVKTLKNDTSELKEGAKLSELSYVFNYVSYSKESYIEGPYNLTVNDIVENVFLFIEPIIVDSEYKGQVVVAIEEDYFINAIGLDYLKERGYDYKLWRINLRDDFNSEIVTSSNLNRDYADSIRVTFTYPSEWILNIIPIYGYVGLASCLRIFAIIIVMAFLTLCLFALVIYYFLNKDRIKYHSNYDLHTGFYNKNGLENEINKLIKNNQKYSSIFYVYEGFDHYSLVLEKKDIIKFLCSLKDRVSECLESKFIISRTGESSFTVIVLEELDEIKIQELAKGIQINCLFSSIVDGKKRFISPRYEYLLYDSSLDGLGVIKALDTGYYRRYYKQSPILDMAKKCKDLCDGKTDVVFENYSDLELQELAKNLSMYKKKVEQLAYQDSSFNIGNRLKLIRDLNMLINYDNKEFIDIFSVDISHHEEDNEVISSGILKEVIKRLSRIFGNYLYRINNGVFAGIAINNQEKKLDVDKISEIFSIPITVNEGEIILNVSIIKVSYPDEANTPESVLEVLDSMISSLDK